MSSTDYGFYHGRGYADLWAIMTQDDWTAEDARYTLERLAEPEAWDGYRVGAHAALTEWAKQNA